MKLVIELPGEPRGIVYKVTNLVTSASYIGITRKGVAVRYAGHWKTSKHEDSILYRAMRKYGQTAFTVETLATAESLGELHRLERELIALHQTHVRNGGYNMTEGGEGSCDICELTRERMQAAATARMATPEIKQKIIKALTGRKASPESIAKSAASRTGLKLTIEHKQKLSVRAKGRIITPEQRLKIAATLRARTDEPWRKALNAAIQSNRGKKWSEERKHSLRKALARPETKARQRAASRRTWRFRKKQNAAQLSLF